MFHLSSFYNTEGGVDSESENSIPSKLPEGVEFQVYDRKTLEEKFKYMDGVFGKGTCDFFVKLFTKYKVLAQHPLDAGASKEVFDVPLKQPLPKTTTTYPIRDQDKSKLKSLLDYLQCCGVIKKMGSDKSYGSPSFIISKKGRALPRLVVDSRNYNKYIESETSVFMQSILSVLKEKVSKSRFLSIIDLKSAYYGIRVSKETVDTGINSFTTIFGTYAFLCLLTGGSYSPNIFTTYILKHLHTSKDMSYNYLHDVIAHYDDLSLFSPKDRSLAEHLQHFTR